MTGDTASQALECLRLLLIAEMAINRTKQRRDLNAGSKARQIAAAVAEKNKLMERAAALVRDAGA